jgi:hypothetical protein
MLYPMYMLEVFQLDGAPPHFSPCIHTVLDTGFLDQQTD